MGIAPTTTEEDNKNIYYDNKLYSSYAYGEKSYKSYLQGNLASKSVRFSETNCHHSLLRHYASAMTNHRNAIKAH